MSKPDFDDFYVSVLQRKLKRIADYYDNDIYDPGKVDGDYGDKTTKAVTNFQKRFMRKPDGIASPGRITIERLDAQLEIFQVDACFPLKKVPKKSWSWLKGMRVFGARRSKGARAHAGSDLYDKEGTPVYAVADGKVIVINAYFYNSTYEIQINHGPFTIRYGEVKMTNLIKMGDNVKKGQQIGEIGHLTGVSLPSDMLHIEGYDNTERGILTVMNTKLTARHPASNRPYFRRKDLISLSELLTYWSKTLP
jgi:murein DD-endopeptidase MepM/ murein hydrolase activator NlpD